MKRFKHVLIMSMIVILAMGVFSACNNKGTYDANRTPYLVTYCANGGQFKGSPEQYVYMEPNTLAIEPGTTIDAVAELEAPEGKRFVGWAVGKVNDETQKPVYIDTPVSVHDAGTYIDYQGDAISAELAQNLDSSENFDKYFTAEQRKYTHGYYDYNPDDLWDFKHDRITGNLVLVAVYTDYNKFIIAQRDANGEWEDLSDLFDGSFGSELEGRLHDVTGDKGTRLIYSDIVSAYESDYEGKTVIDFYKDAECTEVITAATKLIVDQTYTVIYPHDIDGKYAVVSSYSNFSKAVNANDDIYVKADFEAKNWGLNYSNYSGTILGNGHKITGIKIAMNQMICQVGSVNAYGAIFGKLTDATITDLEFVVDSFEFTIAVDPTAQNASSRDEMCYVGLFAASMKNCTITNVKVTINYSVVRSTIQADTGSQDEDGNFIFDEIENTYNVKVTVGEYCANDEGGNEITDCTLSATNVGDSDDIVSEDSGSGESESQE